MKFASGENTELKRSPFEAWSRSASSHIIYATLTARGFFLISTLPVHSPAFFPKSVPFFSCVGCG